MRITSASMPVAVKELSAYPGSDYYEIALVEFTEKMHTALPATRLRGYVQSSRVKRPRFD